MLVTVIISVIVAWIVIISVIVAWIVTPNMKFNINLLTTLNICLLTKHRFHDTEIRATVRHLPNCHFNADYIFLKRGKFYVLQLIQFTAKTFPNTLHTYVLFL